MKVLLSAVLLTMFFSTEVTARDVAGVKLAEQIEVNGTSLQLNGAGVRTKFFFKIYTGALYLPKPARSSKQVYAQADAWRVSMHFLYDEVTKEKLISAWDDGFESNADDEVLKSLRPRIDVFNNLFVAAHKGDVIDIDYQPTTGTIVTMNGKVQGQIEGEDFQQAVLRIWLGEVPADESLKEGMLGASE